MSWRHWPPLSQDLLNDVSVDVSEAHVSRGEAEGALGVVDAEEVEHGGVEIVDLDFVFYGLVAPVVGCSVANPRLDAAAGHPGGKAEGVVIAPVSALGEGSASEFAGPDDERFVEKAEFFQIGDQGGDRLIDGFAVFTVTIDEIVVLVPAIAIAAGAGEFNEADAALHKASGEETLAAKSFGLIEIGLQTIHFFHGVGLAFEVEKLGNRGLHPEGGFVIKNGRFDLLLAGEPGLRGSVEISHEPQFAFLKFGIRLGRFDIGHGGIPGVEDRALISGGKVSGIKIVEPARRDETSVEDDESGKVLVFGTEAIADPGPHAGTSLEARSGVEEVVRRGVFGKLGGHRFDEGEVVGDLGNMGEEVADPGSRLAVLFELPGRLHDLADVVKLGGLKFADGFSGILPVVFFEGRFVVEGVDLRRAAIHVKEDDVLGLRSVVRLLLRKGIFGIVVCGFPVGVFPQKS